MNFLIADTFTASFNRLSGLDQKAVKASVFDLQMDPTGNGLQLHRIDKSKDPNFWSARVNRDVRLIVHKTGDSLLVAYVGHHDDAYAWAERRRIEAHPRTGAVQIVEVRERVEEVAPPATFDFVFPEPAKSKEKAAAPPALFSSLDDNALLSIGVPADWLADVRAASEDGFFALTPPPAGRSLRSAARICRHRQAGGARSGSGHRRSLRASRCVAADQADRRPGGTGTGARLSVGEMGRLPPPFATGAGRAFLLGAGARRRFGGHRQDHRGDPSRRPARPRKSRMRGCCWPVSREPLAAEWRRKCWSWRPRRAVSSPGSPRRPSRGIAEQMFQLEHGVRPRIASDAVLRERLRAAAAATGLKGFSERFLLSEWTNVIDAWGLTSLDAYSTVQRMGRKSRLGPNQRARLWPVFQAVREALAAERYTTWANVFTGLADALARRPSKPFDHVVIDEAQDLAPAELRFFAALAPAKAGWPVPVGRRRTTHFPASIFVGEPRRRRAGPVAHAQGLLPHLAADSSRRG